MIHQWYIPEPKRHHDSENAHKMVYILQELGVEVFCNPYIPFGGMEYSFLDNKRPVIFYGSLNVIKDVQRKNVYLSPFAWCDFDQLKCSTYYSWWGQYLVQKRYALYPLNEIARNRDFIYDIFGKDDQLFIRPDDNFKTFTGEVVEKERFEYWWRHTRDYESGPDCPCVVSRPENIEKEWRLVMIEDKIISGSQYKEGVSIVKEEGFPDFVGEKALEIAKSTMWQPHPIYVMDLALVDDECRLMEIGSFNAAGMYKCDLRKVISAVIELTKEEFISPSK